jgi:hypothetical protein
MSPLDMLPSVASRERIIERDRGFCLLALSGCAGEATAVASRGGVARDLLHGGNFVAACPSCVNEKMSAFVVLDLLERGLRVRPLDTTARTLDRVLKTPVADLAGEWWILRGRSDRRPATSAEIDRHLGEVRA